MDVKLGLSHYGKGIERGCLKTVLRRIFGAKRDEVTGEWRKLHNGKVHNFYTTPDIIRPIKYRKNEVGGTCGRSGRKEKIVQGFWCESPKERGLSENRGIDGRMELK
jgi:hypothetical protein